MAKLEEVNTTDIRAAIELGCAAMSNAFNGDDADIPYGGAQVRPKAFLGGSFEAHTPGRHLNALLCAEAVAGIKLDEKAVEKHAKAAFFSYSQAPLPLSRIGVYCNGEGTPCQLQDHDVREGFHGLWALSAYRNSARARTLAEASIETIFDYWVPDEEWDRTRLATELSVQFPAEGYQTFIQRLARSIGPLVKLYRSTGHEPALELALLLKDKALREFFFADGSFATERFGSHTHSTTCVLSSLAQLAELTEDGALMERVKVFYDNGLWALRDQIGWSIEVTGPGVKCRRGEANNTGDIIETALVLARWGYRQYFGDAERMLRSHLLPSQLRDVSFVVEPENPDGVDGFRNVAQRLRGGFGFPAPYGHEPAGIWQSEKPRIGFNLDIVGGAVASLCAAYGQMVRFDGKAHWVDMLFDCQTADIEVESPYTNSCLAVCPKKPGAIRVRLPERVEPRKVEVEGAIGEPRFADGYLHLAESKPGKWIHFAFELPVYEMALTWQDSSIRARFIGDEVVAMDNFATDLTFFAPFE